MNLLFPLGMAALGALVPLALLYLLKQKRIEQKVPTNFLWARAVEDLRASSLFQRLRTSILLLLQAAAIVLCALAAAGASLDLTLGGAPRHVILLVDTSASMKATDEDGRARIDAAKDLATDLVDGLSAEDEMMIVTFDLRAEVAAAFTDDKARLASAVKALSARDLGTRPSDALMLAVSFAQASKGFDTEITVMSDGAVEEDLPAVPFPVTFVRLGKSGANQGIASVQLSRSLGEKAQVFVHAENGSADAVQRNVALTKAGEVLDARTLSLPANGGATAFFEMDEPEGKEPVVFTVSLEGRDVLAADDSVSFVMRPSVPRTGIVVSAEPMLWLDPAKIGRLHPGLALVAATEEEAASMLAKGEGAVDLVCYAGVSPKTLPSVAAQIYIDALPPGSGLVRGAKLEYPIIVDWDRTHPTTARCQFDDILVTESVKLTGAERSRVLIDSTGGPLVLLTPVPGREVVVLAFSPGNSNFPLKLSWPLFLANTFDYLLSRTERAGEEPVSRTGTPIALGAAPATRVTTPSGSTIDVAPDARGHVTFAATVDAGVYRVKSGDAEQVRACALLDPAEIRVAPHEKLLVGGEKLAATERPTQRNVLLRDPLLLAALGVLLLEWALWCGRR